VRWAVVKALGRARKRSGRRSIVARDWVEMKSDVVAVKGVSSGGWVRRRRDARERAIGTGRGEVSTHAPR